jgi:hypothetical protein
LTFFKNNVIPYLHNIGRARVELPSGGKDWRIVVTPENAFAPLFIKMIDNVGCARALATLSLFAKLMLITFVCRIYSRLVVLKMD